jgi:hypothetical protein
MSVVCIHLFFSFDYDGIEYPCALVEWFTKVGRKPDDDTGMWTVKPEVQGRQGDPFISVIHLDSLL